MSVRYLYPSVKGTEVLDIFGSNGADDRNHYYQKDNDREEPPEQK